MSKLINCKVPIGMGRDVRQRAGSVNDVIDGILMRMAPTISEEDVVAAVRDVLLTLRQGDLGDTLSFRARRSRKALDKAVSRTGRKPNSIVKTALWLYLVKGRRVGYVRIVATLGKDGITYDIQRRLSATNALEPTMSVSGEYMASCTVLEGDSDKAVLELGGLLRQAARGRISSALAALEKMEEVSYGTI